MVHVSLRPMAFDCTVSTVALFTTRSFQCGPGESHGECNWEI